ncbi:MAG: acetyl-CoA carboxylase biotin carboxyl carrier protein [Kofleriaceae bacterium]
MAPRGKTKAEEPESGEQPFVAIARGLAEIVAEHNLSELILDTKELTLTVRRGGTSAAPAQVQYAPQYAQSFAPPPAAAAPAPAVVEDKAHIVTSPFVGTFYRKPNPESPNYCSLHDKVDKGKVLCIVEAMKLMNEIEADVAGTITAILVDDGAPVEYGQPQFKIL